jgi:hypothetical protein
VKVGAKLTISMVIVLAIGTVLLFTFSNPVAGWPGQYYADGYGYQYPDGLDTWNSTNGHSGMKWDWSASNPSVHYSICNHAPAWPWTLYHNAGYDYPNLYLCGNGLFVFSGHGPVGGHALVMYNGSNYSFVYDHSNNNPGNQPAIYISEPRFGLDYMKLAFLNGCETSLGWYDIYGNPHPDGSLAWWWRCGKGTDCVVGWQRITTLAPTNEYQERFFQVMIQGQSYAAADSSAMLQVTLQFGSPSAGNCNSRLLWGHTDWSASTPGWGVYEGMQ